MRVLDLFSGIGGFSLGLEAAGMETIAFCEKDEFCQKVLSKHWPEKLIYDDIKELTYARLINDGIEPPNLICGGFPCQPFSTASAGKQKGEAHDEYLWPEMLRVVKEFWPDWVIGENVIGIGRMALEKVVTDLEAAAYNVQCFVIPACGVGAGHRRDRIWILAHTNSGGEPVSPIDAKAQVLPRLSSEPPILGEDDGISRRMDRCRLKALGNAVVPQVVKQIGKAIMKVQYG